MIHPVVHVSLLRRAHPPESDDQVRLPPPIPDQDERQQDEPEQVLQRRQYLRGSTARSQVLIKWSSLPGSLATWEDEAQLRHRFPVAPAWGQAVIEEGSNVTPVTSGPRTRRERHDPTPREPIEEDAEAVPRRSRRARQPSVRLDPMVWQLK